MLGLAWPVISNLNENPFFVTIANAGAVDANQFGFYLASSGSTLYLGGMDENKYSTRGFEFIRILPPVRFGSRNADES
jgi:cathepsin D